MQPLKGRRLLLVNTGSVKKRFTVQVLKSLGAYVIALNDQVNWAKPYVDQWILADHSSAEACIAAVESFNLSHPDLSPEGALTFWEDAVLLTARLSDHFGYVGIPYYCASVARNKFAFREFSHKQGIPSPRHALVSAESDFARELAGFSYPLVVKPAYGSSSAYVVKVETLQEVEKTVRYIQNSLSVGVESALRDGRQIMVEEYVEGHEVDVDILLQNGKLKFWSISDNERTKEPYFVESGQTIPSRLPRSEQLAILAQAETTLEKLGVQNACIHFEAKATPKGPVPIEVNLRMGGDEVYYFVKGAWGVDLVQHAALIALGEYFPPKAISETPIRYMTGKYFLSDCSGVVSTLRIAQGIKKEPGVVEFQFFKKVGDAVLVPPEGYEFLGWIAVAGQTYNEAEEKLQRVFKQVEVKVSPFHSSSSIGQTTRRTNLSLAVLRKERLLGAAKIELLRRLSRAEQRTLHVGVAANVYENTGRPIEDELTADAKAIYHTLSERGYTVSFYNFNDPLTAVRNIREQGVQLVFNICERINDSSLLEPHAAALLDIIQIPYTGSNPFTLSLCLDKIRVKKLLSFHGIPTPNWDYAYAIEDEINKDLRFPLIVKPANSDSSIGITNDSVVADWRSLRDQLERVIVELGRPALIEEYIDGDEYDVSILGNDRDSCRVLPLSRSCFDKLPGDFWHIYPFEGKFGENTLYREHITVQRPPKNISRKLTTLISEIALDTYSILGCSDYGRVEIRVDRQDNPLVLELNPNPSIGEKDCVPSVAKLVGMDYGDFLEEIIALTIARYRDRPPYHYLQTSLL